MNIAILGLGTVGKGLFDIAQKLDGFTVKRILEIRESGPLITANIEDILRDPSIDLVAETMGGLHPTFEFAKAVLESGKHFVTSNKLLVSVYGAELTCLARSRGKAFLFDAACGGGIAYLSNMEIARRIDNIQALGGILNGTTNFILDAMQSGKQDYATALTEAQHLGYAERDPSSDVNGLDTMRKLVLSCAVGFNSYLDIDAIPVMGISKITPVDIEWAKQAGGVLKLCAYAKKTQNSVSAYVEPTVLSASSPDANVRGSQNFAWYMGENCGQMSFIGAGAGRYPTAFDVMRDIYTANEGRLYMTEENCAKIAPNNATEKHAYYLRVLSKEAVPSELIEEKTSCGNSFMIRTVPISVQKMHRMFSEKEDVFFAGIQKG